MAVAGGLWLGRVGCIYDKGPRCEQHFDLGKYVKVRAQWGASRGVGGLLRTTQPVHTGTWLGEVWHEQISNLGRYL